MPVSRKEWTAFRLSAYSFSHSKGLDHWSRVSQVFSSGGKDNRGMSPLADAFAELDKVRISPN
jgi:hypothetical protein